MISVMSSLLNFLVLLSLGTEGLSISINDILGFGYRRLVQPESPRVVEVIRWRQSVCLTSAPGVLPCLINLQSPENSEDNNPEELETDVENLKSSSSLKIGDSSLKEDSDLLAKRKTRQTSAPPRLYSSKVVERLSLEKMGSSTFQNPVQGSPREAKYLKVAPQTHGQTIYKVKVIDSPVIAELVAETCLPDIGIPMCDEGNDTANPGYRKPSKVEPLKPVSKPSISVPVLSSGGSIELWQNQGTNLQNSQGLLDFLNRPNVIEMDKEPSVDQVLVIQPTSSPSIFAGINGLLPLNPLPLPLPGLFQIPGIPSLQQILYRPENDISENQGILGVITGGQGSSNPPGTGPPTEKPGIFGGLFSSPSRPVDFEAQTPNPPGLPSIFNGFGNVFNPVNRPLLIERPNKKPILVEKPVYVIERPAALGLFDILQNPLTQSGSSATEKPDVLKDPVYVLQKPAPLFGTGLLPNWNLFNIVGGGTSTTEKPEIDPEGILAPSYQLGIIDKIPSSGYDPLIDPRLPEAPEIPEKPIVKPLADNTDATIFSASGISEKDDQGFSSSFSVSLLTPEGSKKDLKESDGDGKNSLKKNEMKINEGDRTEAVGLKEKILKVDENLSNFEFGNKEIGSEIAKDKRVENEA